jgi:hypothetical protein
MTTPGTMNSAPVPPAKSERLGPHGMHVRPKLVVMLWTCALAVAMNERTIVRSGVQGAAIGYVRPIGSHDA